MRLIKIRRIGSYGKVLTGFAGSAADAFALWKDSRKKWPNIPTTRAPGGNRVGQGLANRPRSAPVEVMLAVADASVSLIVKRAGDVIEPSDGIIGIGSGGPLRPGRRQGPGRPFQLPAKQVEEALKSPGRFAFIRIRISRLK